MSDQIKGSKRETQHSGEQSSGNPEAAPLAYPPREALLEVAGRVAHYPPCSKLVFRGRVLLSNDTGGWVDCGPADPLGEGGQRDPERPPAEEVVVVVT